MPRRCGGSRRSSGSSRRCMVSADWTPYEKTLQAGVFASRFPGAGQALWTIVNRNEYEVDGRADRRRARGRHGVLRRVERRAPGAAHRRRAGALLAEARGARLRRDPRGRSRRAGRGSRRDSSSRCSKLARTPLQLVLRRVALAAAAAGRDRANPRRGRSAGGHDRDSRCGVRLRRAGHRDRGPDLGRARRPVSVGRQRAPQRIAGACASSAFYIDRYPVTNAQYKAFLDASGYRPRDDHNFLRHWQNAARRDAAGRTSP